MATLTKAEFDALPDSLKTEFKADGESYVLVKEDVEGLKKSKAEILAEKKRIADEKAALEQRLAEIDAQNAQADEEKLKQAGQFEELKKKYETRHAEELSKLQAERDANFAAYKRERLENELTRRGVLPDRTRHAFVDVADQLDLVQSENGFGLALKGGIGDAKEVDALFENLKTKSPWLFQATAQAGSGASGSQNGGNGAAKVWTRAQWDAAGTPERVAFSKEGGRVTD